MYMKQTVRTRGLLVCPVDDLLKRTQSVTTKKGVKIPKKQHSRTKAMTSALSRAMDILEDANERCWLGVGGSYADLEE